MAEPYSSDQVRKGALHAVCYSENRVPCAGAACPSGTVKSRRDRQTLAHGYERPSASLGDESGVISIALGLFASPLLIVSTESVVVMGWKGMRTSTAASTEIYGMGRPGCNRCAHDLPLHDHD